MNQQPLHTANSSISERLQAYLENRLSAEERLQMESWLAENPDEADALMGLQALGPDAAADMAAAVERDIAILTAPEESRRKGLTRRLGYVRMGLAAAILLSFGGGLWLLSRLQKQQEAQQAFERHFEPLSVEPGATTEQLPVGPVSSDQDGAEIESPSTYSMAEEDREDVLESEEANSGSAPAQESLKYLELSEPDAKKPDLEKKQRTPVGKVQIQDRERAEDLDIAMEDDDMGWGATPQESEADASPSLYLNSAPSVDIEVQSAPSSVRANRAPVSGRAVAAEERVKADVISRDSLSDYRLFDQSPALSKTQESGLDEVVTLSSVSGNRGYKAAPDPYVRGKAYYQEGDYKQALAWLEKVAASHPHSAEARLMAANAWLERDKPDRAEPILRELVLNGPAALREQSQWYLSLTWIALGRKAEAVKLLELLQMTSDTYAEKAAGLLRELGQ